MSTYFKDLKIPIVGISSKLQYHIETMKQAIQSADGLEPPLQLHDSIVSQCELLWPTKEAIGC